jgi:hypothetical protein
MLKETEIVKHIAFFQKCEMDYKLLAERLIKELANQLKIEIDFQLPLRTFKPFYNSSQNGQMNEWNYFFHGHHCFFKSELTQQKVEVSLVNGINFGTLDPLFFAEYILSTSKYYPLPVTISEPFKEGIKIIEVLRLSLNK